jgi:hypothetical protein
MRAPDMSYDSLSMESSQLIVDANVPKFGIKKTKPDGEFRVEVLQLGKLTTQYGVSLPISAAKRVLDSMSNTRKPTRR